MLNFLFNVSEPELRFLNIMPINSWEEVYVVIHTINKFFEYDLM